MATVSSPSSAHSKGEDGNQLNGGRVTEDADAAESHHMEEAPSIPREVEGADVGDERPTFQKEHKAGRKQGGSFGGSSSKREHRGRHNSTFLARMLPGYQRSPSKSSSSSSESLQEEPNSPASARHSAQTIHKALTIESARAFQEVMYKETEIEVGGGRCVIHPDRPLRLAWDLVALFAIIYQAILVPYELAFSSENPSGEACIYNAMIGASSEDAEMCFVGALNLVVDMFFLFDIMMNFMTGFHHKGTLVMEPSRCAWNYFRTWFIIDLLGIFPWRYITPGEQKAGAAKLLRMLKFLKFVRLLKLLRVLKLRNLLIKLEDHVRSEYLYFVFQLVKLSLSLLLLCHVTACTWYGIGLISMDLRGSDNERHVSWIEFQDLQDEEGSATTDGERYMAALYFTMATMTTVGYGDISAGTFPLERAFGTLTLLGGTGVFAMLLSSISSSVSQPSTANSATGADMNRAALRYLWKNGISGELTVQIRKYLQQREEAKEDVAVESYLRESISQNLLQDLCVEGFRSTVLKFDFFEDFCNNTIAEICFLCARARICPGEVLFAEGDEADGMYFIVKGSVLVFKHSRRQEDPVPELSQGMYFGEACFFLDVAIRHASVVGKVFCELVTISKGSFLRLAEWNDEVAEAVQARRKAREDFAERQSQALKLLPEEESRMGTQCGLCKMLGHYPDECPITYRFDNHRRELLYAQPIPPVTPVSAVVMQWLPWGGCCPRRLTKLRDFGRLRRRRLTIFGYVNELPGGDGPFLFVPRSEVLYQQHPQRPSRTHAIGAFLGILPNAGSNETSPEFARQRSRSSITSRGSVLSQDLTDLLDAEPRNRARASTDGALRPSLTRSSLHSRSGPVGLQARSMSNLGGSRPTSNLTERFSRLWGKSTTLTALQEELTPQTPEDPFGAQSAPDKKAPAKVPEQAVPGRPSLLGVIGPGAEEVASSNGFTSPFASSPCGGTADTSILPSVVRH